MAVPGIGRRTAEAVQTAIAEPPPEGDDATAAAPPAAAGTALATGGLVAS
jgi:hypothetical protein